MLRRFADAGANESALASVFGPLLLRTPPSFGVIRYFSLHNITGSMKDMITHHESIVSGLQLRPAGSRRKSTRPDLTMRVSDPNGAEIGTYTIRPATFGPELAGLDAAIRGSIVLCDPSDAQGPIKNQHEVNGRIVVCERGGCTFSHKVLECQVAGATAVIVCNTLDGDGVHMTPDSGAPECTIPAFMISKMDGYFLKAALPGATGELLNLQANKQEKKEGKSAASGSPSDGMAEVKLQDSPDAHMPLPSSAEVMASVGLGTPLVPQDSKPEEETPQEEIDLETDIADVLGDMDDLLGSPSSGGAAAADADFDIDDFDTSLLEDDSLGL